MIGKNIKKIREIKKLGVNEAARKAGISGGYLSSLERGEKKNPSMSLLNSIAAALDVNLDELVKDDCSLSYLSVDISLDECMQQLEYLLKSDCQDSNKILYSNALNFLKELNDLREFKNKILSVTNE